MYTWISRGSEVEELFIPVMHTDIFNLFNQPNVSLQGKGISVVVMCEKMDGFKIIFVSGIIL